MRRQLLLQARSNPGPLRLDNTVIHGMPDTAARGDHVVPKDTFFFGADAQNGRPRGLIQRIRLELDTDAAQLFKCMLQEQQLRLGVHRRALPSAAQPRPADLHAAVLPVDVQVPRAANHAPARFFNNGEWQRHAPALFIQGLLNRSPQVVGSAHRLGEPPPNLGIQSHLAKRLLVRRCQGVQAHGSSFQRYRLDFHGVLHHGSLDTRIFCVRGKALSTAKMDESDSGVRPPLRCRAALFPEKALLQIGMRGERFVRYDGTL